jgi:predicted RNA-binding Zn-ribbon protein involved in translation (DUF1610 family)
MEAAEIVLDEARALACDDDVKGADLRPASRLQDLAIDNGWGDEFLRLANRYDCARSGKAIHRCSRCDNEAATLTCENGTFTRATFTGTLTQPETASVRAAIGDARTLHALDLELAPFYCPTCRRTYCGDHWRVEDVFDEDGFHDAIRGACPEGHERLLED